LTKCIGPRIDASVIEKFSDGGGAAVALVAAAREFYDPGHRDIYYLPRGHKRGGFFTRSHAGHTTTDRPRGNVASRSPGFYFRGSAGWEGVRVGGRREGGREEDFNLLPLTFRFRFCPAGTASEWTPGSGCSSSAARTTVARSTLLSS